MIWRQISVTGSADRAPESIFIVGMNVPAGSDARDLEEFNTFYTGTHVPEVMAYGGYARATRCELFRGFVHPPPGAPQFCAIYEADAEATEARATRRAARPQLSPGPPVWTQHDTLWRLVYRRIPDT